MMNTRTRNAPAKTASGTTNHQEIGRHTYIKYHSKAYGTTVLTICHKASGVDDFWYSATIAFHAALSTCGLVVSEFKELLIN